MPSAAPRLHVGVLGPLELRWDGPDGPLVPVPPGRRLRLLAALLLARGRVVPVDRLVAALWLDDPPDDARAALHTTVARLRRALGPAADLLVRRPPGYAFDVTAVDLDADEFGRLRDQARAAEPAAAVPLWDRALELWRGAAWEDVAEDLAQAEAVALEELRRQTWEERAAALLAAGRPGEAVTALEPMVLAEPLRERAVALLMEAQHQHAGVAPALATYGRHRVTLAEELGLDPSPALARHHQALLRGEPDVAPPAPRPASPPPPAVAVTPSPGLLGREAHLQTLAAVLQHGQLVTVVGPGGVGKTTLVRAWTRAGGRTCWWVDLAALTDPQAVLPAAATALGVEVHPGSDLPTALRRRAAQADGILVLDNCEHLLEPVAELVALLLPAGPRLQVLATSRERIGDPVERVFPLPPLRLPAPDLVDETAPAVALFLARARAVAPDLPHDEDTLRMVGEICRRLDGLPLAIELAAGRVGTLALPDVAARLDSRFRLLRQPRGAARHQTLTAAVDWSYQLLTPVERTAFTKLSVFAATFDLAAAEQVLASPDVPVEEVADVVGRLVDRSLLVRPGTGSDGRYRMLETLRGYASERLDAASRAELAHRHGAWVAAALAEARLGLQGPDEARWSTRMEELLPDIRRAVAHAVAVSDAELAARLVAPLHRWAYFRLRADVLDLARPVLVLPGPTDPGVLTVASASAWLAGRLREAVGYARQAIENAGGPDADAAATAHDALGDATLGLGELTVSAAAFRQAALLARRRGSADDTLLGLTGHALALLYAGEDIEQARAEARAATAGRVSPTARALWLYLEGEALVESDATAGLRALAEAQRLAGEVGSTLVVGVAATAATALLARSGPLTAATYEQFVAAIDHWLGTGNLSLFLTCLRNLVPLLSRAGADGTVLELAASLAADPSDHPSYGGEAARIDAAVAAARRHLPSTAAEEHWRTGSGRSTEEAGRAAQQVLRTLAGRPTDLPAR